MKRFFVILFTAALAIVLFSCENNDDSNDVKNVVKFTPRFNVENVDAVFNSSTNLKSTSALKSTLASPNIYTYNADGLIDMISVVDDNGDGFIVVSLAKSFDLNKYFAYFEGVFSVVVGDDMNTGENVDSIFYKMLIRKSDGRMFEMPHEINVFLSTMYSLNASFEYDRNGNLYFSDFDGDVYKFNGGNTETPEFTLLFNQYMTEDPHNEVIPTFKPYIVVDEDYLVLHSYSESQIWVYRNGVLKHYDYYEQQKTNSINVMWSNNNGKIYAYTSSNAISQFKLSEITFTEDSVIVTDISNTNGVNGIDMPSMFTMKNENGDCYFINQNANGFWHFNNTEKTFEQVSLNVDFVATFSGNDDNVFVVVDTTNNTNKVVYYNADKNEVVEVNESFDRITDVVVSSESTSLKSTNSVGCKITVATVSKIYTIDVKTGEVIENEKTVSVENLIGM